MAEFKKVRNNLPEGIADEKTAFENEKTLLQRSAVLAEQRASGLQELWRSCKADLAAARLSAAQVHAQLNTEKTRVRQAKDENEELLEKISEKEDEIARILEDLKAFNENATQLKKEISAKDEYIQSIENDKKTLQNELQKKEEEIKQKDIELHREMLKTEELNDKVEQLAVQIQKLQDRLDKWPIYLIANNISCLCLNATKNMYTKIMKIASIFSL